jgi:hypothetical protein
MGKLSGEGIPPAREITPGFETTFKISLMALAFIRLVLSERRRSKSIISLPALMLIIIFFM